MSESQRHIQNLRRQARQQLQKQTGDVSKMSTAAIQEALQELRIHQIELHMQNEELMRTRQEAEAERDRFAELYDSVPVGYLTVDHNGKILEANRASMVLLASERNALVGRLLADFIVLEDQHTCFSFFQQVFKTKHLRQGELRFRRGDGSHLMAFVEAQVVALPTGADRSCRVIMSDITARKQAEEVIHQRDWLQVTLASIGDGVLTTDTAGCVTFLNREAERLIGWTLVEALGREADKLFRLMNEQTRQPIESPVLRVLEQEADAQAEQWALLPVRSGGELAVAVSATAIRGNDANLHGVVLIFRDVTKQRQLEERLRQSQKMEAIGTLAGGVAHDFNNMLAAILGYAELISYDLPSTSLAADYLKEVLAAGRRARDVVKQILTFSRQHTVQHKPIQLHLVIEEALTLLWASLPSTISVQHQLDKTAGVVVGDPTQIQQVIINLCANAGYSMRGTVGTLTVSMEAVEVDTILAATHPDLRPGPYIRIAVQDTGPGIQPNILRRIFEPYFTTKSASEGTGMGLAVVHGIVSSHSGAITVQSQPGKGATFAVYLPRILDMTADRAPTWEKLPGGSERILLIDDEEALARMGQTMLTRLGYTVVLCCSSLDALETFQAAPQAFDLVITDQTMPHMTGDMLAQALRRLRPDIPLILCTGFSHNIDAHKAQALGIDAFVMKPWEFGDLTRTVREILERRRGSTIPSS